MQREHGARYWSCCRTIRFCASSGTLGRESQCICGTKVKTPWDAAHSGSQTSQCNQVQNTMGRTICRSVVFRSLAVHFSIAKFSNSPSGRVCTVMSHNVEKKYIYISTDVKHHVDTYPHMHIDTVFVGVCMNLAHQSEPQMPTQSELHHHRLPNCPRTTDTIQ